MAIYKMLGDKDRLELIQESSFNDESVREVEDLQRLILDQPEVLEAGLFIIRAEFSEWQDSKRRIDLLALDESGRLVVVELKRGQTGELSELQAIRYAAMVANLTLDRIIDTYQSYFGGTDEEIRSNILAHLGASEEEEFVLDTAKPRIILACEGFSKELTTTVLWLNACDLEIKCVRLKSYRINGEVLVETSQIIPLPEATDFIEQFQERERANRRQKTGGSRRVLGHDEFRESIAKANEEFRTGLNILLDSAISLEKEGVVDLSTFTNRQGHYVRLELRLPGTNKYLVSFNNLLFQGGSGEISFWPGWEDASPKALSDIDELLGDSTSKSGVRHRRLSTAKTSSILSELLNAIADAYREANGLLTEDPASGE